METQGRLTAYGLCFNVVVVVRTWRDQAAPGRPPENGAVMGPIIFSDASSSASFLKGDGGIWGENKARSIQLKVRPLKSARQKCHQATPARPKNPPAQNRGVGPVSSPMGSTKARNTPPCQPQ